ncbi:MAG: cation:proton antiporter [Rikenellaceae bacterium]
MTSVLLAGMFSTHTLLAYPILSKMGVKRNRAVTITIGGTVIAETLALLVLAVVVGLTDGNGVVGMEFWLTLGAKFIAFAGVIFYIFPIVARYILKRCSDGMMQYIFILFMLFLGSILAQVAGLEGIIGALFTGLALNRLIPNSSSLMNRIEFVGNAIFIPFFLIGVGMLIDYRVFISDWGAIYTSVVMTAVALITKYIAAFATQKSFGYNSDERSIIFGLSGAHAAATLAVVLVGHNIILGYDTVGDPIRLLDSTILNATIVIIFITCSVASISAQRGAYKLSMRGALNMDDEMDESGDENEENGPRILLPFNSLNSIDETISLTNMITSPKCSVTVASVISDAKDEGLQVSQAKTIFERAKHKAAASERTIDTVMRYDVSYTNGIANVIRDHNVSDLMINIDNTRDVSTKLISKIIDGPAPNSSVTTFMYRSKQPIATIRRYLIVIPPNAEMEPGFRLWLFRIWKLLRATGASASIYARRDTFKIIKQVNEAVPLPIQMHEYLHYRDILIISRNLRRNDGLIFVLSRKLSPSYVSHMERIPQYINNYFSENSFILIYPYQTGAIDGELKGMTNVASICAVSKIEDVIDSVINIIKSHD